MRFLFGFLCALALGSMPMVGCTDGGGTGGTGGTAGSGGTSGMPECQGDDDCNDGNECTENTCAEGVCGCMPVEDGGGCSFGLMGPSGVCVAGECRLACETAEDCYDGNDCTEDACPIDGGGVCDHTPVADGTVCAGGSCQGGACELTGSVLPCSEQGVRNAIAAGGGPYTFDCVGPTTVVTQATIVVDKDVILDGEGNLALDGNEDHGVFDFSSKSNGCLDTPPCESEVRVELSALTVSGGMASTNPAFHVQECVDVQLTRSSVTGNAGRGIENAGTLTLTDVTVSDNEEGIFNTVGILKMTKCTVSGNTGARPGSGGIIGGGTITMTNCTVSGNAGPLPEGGGIVSDGTLTMTNCTVSGNTAGNHSGDIVFRGGTATITNTLVDGACVQGRATVVTSNGYNIESPGNTCGFDQSTDMPAMSADDLKLGELADNGGPTMTHALEAGSEAINKIPADACELEEDQRGEPRPETDGDACDTGAFERQPDDPQRALDMLILIDDSASMRDEQQKLQDQVARLVNLLLTGGEAEPGAVGVFPEVQSLHVGIITPDLGHSTDPPHNYTAGSDPSADFNPTPACMRNNGNGKAGFMQVEGLRGEPRVPCQAQTPPEGTLYLNYPEPGFTAADLISDVECVMGQSDGCGFEQQLEAILASDRNTANGGFSREGALLAIILITDEDDCSTTDPRVFDVEPRPGNPYQGPFTSMNEVQFNLRCWAHSQALQQIQRYVDSIADLKGDPSQAVFAAITGIPEDSALDRENFNSDEERYDAILAADAMQEVPDPSTDDTQRQQLTPACTATDGSGSAAPGRRIVETMRGLAADNTGVGTVVESICAADYAPALNAIVDRIAAALRRH